MVELKHDAILVLPRIRVQNANAISSPLTWGFPAMTAFTGLMVALERKLGRDAGIGFFAVGVVCHDFEAQVTNDGFVSKFNLTRNPVSHDGTTAGIVEEGRMHLELSLVFDVRIASDQSLESARLELAKNVQDTLCSMRIAGGSVISSGLRTPVLELTPDQPDEAQKQFRRIMRRILPGFALVSRDDLVAARLLQLREADASATVLDAWLDLSRWNHRAEKNSNDEADTAATWKADKRVGWTVPIPVGFTAISKLYAPGEVANSRDASVPFRFVEPIWSMGQWVSPHRIAELNQLVWRSDYEEGTGDLGGVYRCRNEYQPTTTI